MYRFTSFVFDEHYMAVLKAYFPENVITVIKAVEHHRFNSQKTASEYLTIVSNSLLYDLFRNGKLEKSCISLLTNPETAKIGDADSDRISISKITSAIINGSIFLLTAHK